MYLLPRATIPVNCDKDALIEARQETRCRAQACDRKGAAEASWHLTLKPYIALLCPAYDYSPGPVVCRPCHFQHPPPHLSGSDAVVAAVAGTGGGGITLLLCGGEWPGSAEGGSGIDVASLLSATVV